MKELFLLREILLLVKKLLEGASKFSRKIRLKRVVTKAKEEGDQRGVEEALSGVSGQPTEHEYDELRTQPAQKRRGDMAD